MNIGANIKRIRKERKMTQQQLADKLCVNRQSISQWEKGETFPQVDRIAEIAKALGCSPLELICDNDVYNISFPVDYTDKVKAVIDKLKEYKTEDEEEKIIQFLSVQIAEIEIQQKKKLIFELPISEFEKETLKLIENKGIDTFYFIDKDLYYYIIAGQLFLKAKDMAIQSRKVNAGIIQKKLHIEEKIKEMLL